MMRLDARKSVDLPHPDGPIIAVIFPAGTTRLTSCRAWKSPYQRLKSTTSMAGARSSAKSTSQVVVGSRVTGVGEERLGLSDLHALTR